MKVLSRFSLEILMALAPVAAAQAEVTMTPMDDRGRAVIVKPWDSLTEQERIDQLRALMPSLEDDHAKLAAGELSIVG